MPPHRIQDSPLDEQKDCVRRAVERLLQERPRAGAVFLLHFHESIPEKDLAQSLGVHPSQITRDKQWAVARFTQLLDELLEADWVSERTEAK